MKGMEVNCDTNPNSMTSTMSSMGSPNDGTPGCALKRSSFQSPRLEYAAKQLIVGKGVVLKAEVASADLVVIEVTSHYNMQQHENCTAHTDCQLPLHSSRLRENNRAPWRAR
jgi:hypothetical protein